MCVKRVRHKRAYRQRAGLRVGRSIYMLDLIMLAIAVAFFVLSVGYAYACERL
jgi:hypothetical protein